MFGRKNKSTKNCGSRQVKGVQKTSNVESSSEMNANSKSTKSSSKNSSSKAWK